MERLSSGKVWALFVSLSVSQQLKGSSPTGVNSSSGCTQSYTPFVNFWHNLSLWFTLPGKKSAFAIWTACWQVKVNQRVGLCEAWKRIDSSGARAWDLLIDDWQTDWQLKPMHTFPLLSLVPRPIWEWSGNETISCCSIYKHQKVIKNFTSILKVSVMYRVGFCCVLRGQLSLYGESIDVQISWGQFKPKFRVQNSQKGLSVAAKQVAPFV